MNICKQITNIYNVSQLYVTCVLCAWMRVCFMGVTNGSIGTNILVIQIQRKVTLWKTKVVSRFLSLNQLVLTVCKCYQTKGMCMMLPDIKHNLKPLSGGP